MYEHKGYVGHNYRVLTLRMLFIVLLVVYTVAHVIMGAFMIQAVQATITDFFMVWAAYAGTIISSLALAAFIAWNLATWRD